MTVPQQSESARLAQLEQRVQALEDVNAIRHLKARYAAYCDDQYNPEGLAALFTEDAVEGGVSIELITGTLLRSSQWIHEVHQLN